MERSAFKGGFVHVAANKSYSAKKFPFDTTVNEKFTDGVPKEKFVHLRKRG